MATRTDSKKSRSLAPAIVTEVEDLSPRLRRIRLKGETLRGLKWKPGQKVKIQAGPKLRSYTPARVDTSEGWMDIVFFLHGNGEASAWASAASEGQQTGFVGPASSMPLVDSTPVWALFLGDETTIGLAAALLESLPGSVDIDGVIELDESDCGALRAFGLPLGVALRKGPHGQALLDWLEDTELPSGDGVVWLSGEAETVRALKTVLLDRGMERSQLKIKPYWSIKGHAHRKAIQADL
jgi:NADPH-dependent ferric siderophore reductase